jgi:nicotinamide mononucleotide transporter
VTWGSVVTTWMVARRVIENWLYWIVVDAIAAWLYFSQGLLVTTVLFVIYLGIVVRGYFAWRRELSLQRTAGAAQTLLAEDHVASCRGRRAARHRQRQGRKHRAPQARPDQRKLAGAH